MAYCKKGGNLFLEVGIDFFIEVMVRLSCKGIGGEGGRFWSGEGFLGWRNK